MYTYNKIAHPVHFPDPINISILFGEDLNLREVLSPLRYFLTSYSISIEIPSGFITDYASVPRLFWSWIPPWGEYGPAAILHDYLYDNPAGLLVPNPDNPCSNTKPTRRIADKIFLIAMEQLDVSWAKRTLIYQTTRCVGGPYYNKYRSR